MFNDKYVHRKFLNNLVILLSFIILSILCTMILFHTHVLLGASDMQFHLRRIQELRESFINGNYFPHFSFNEFNGSSAMTMYPYINILPIVLFSFVIKSGIKLIYFSFIINNIIAFIISYYSSLTYNSNKLLSYLFSILYCTSTFYLDYEFFNMDLGMLSVITFLPLVLFGFIHLLNNNKWLELSIGMTLVIFSHVLSIFIISAFLLVWLLINFNRINKKLIINLCKAIVLTMITTAIFWIPFIHLTLLNAGSMNRPGAGNLYGTNFIELFSGALLGKASYAISIFPILGIVLSLILFRHLSKIEKQMSILSILIVIVCSNLFPWKFTLYGIFRVFRGFQFTWRFYIIPQILLSYISAVCIYKILIHVRKRKITFLGIIVVSLLFQLVGQVSIVNNNIDSSPLTSKFISSHTKSINKPTKQYVHYRVVYMNTLDIPHSKNMKWPPFYKIQNQQQYNNVISPYVSPGIDYYPMNSLSKINLVVNNYAFSKNDNRIPVIYNGYNSLKFYNKKNDNKLYMPWVKYNGENIKTFVNGKLIKNLNNKYSLVEVNHLKKGLNRVKVNSVNNKSEIIIEIFMLLLGLMTYCVLFIRDLL